MSPTVNSGRSRNFILAAICLSALVLPLSFTGGAVATPAIGRDLGGSAAELTWLTNAFMLSFGSLLMAAGALADQYGRKRVFTAGMMLFTIASVALSAAPSVLWLDTLRAIQGVGAAAALAGGSAALAQEFEGHARARAFSLLGTTFGVGLAFGPVVAGALIELFGWRSIFVTTAIIGAIALAFGVSRMRETRDPEATGLDWPGTLTFSGTLALFTFGVIQAPEIGWGHPLIVGMLAASAVLLATFVAVEMRVARPMLDLTLFRIPRFVGVQMLPIGTCYSYIVLVILLPLRLIGIEGLSEVQTGWIMVALSAPMLIVPTLVVSLTRWVSAGALSALGFVIAAAGLQWLRHAGMHGDAYAMILPMIVIGAGAGMPWGLMDGLSLSVVPTERAGMAAGIFNTTRVAGEGLTLAIVSALLSALAAARLASPGLMSTGLASDPGSTGAVDAGLAGEIAQRLATGDMAHAMAALPSLPRAVLADAYSGAFASLLHILTAVTILSAIAVFCFLRGLPAQQALAPRAEAA